MAVNAIDSQVQISASAQENYLTSSVMSQDGTTIGYRQLGRGPGLVILHGAMESAASHMQLAETLADVFTVYLPDRRGRGLSGSYGNNYGIEKDVQDLDALLTKIGAHFVFGVSSGAIIALEAALTLTTIKRVAIFEPPLSINGIPPTAFLAQYDQEMARGDVTAALVTGMIGAQMGPPIFAKMPRWLLKIMARMMMANQEKRAVPGEVTMRALAPTLHYDFLLVDETKDKQDKYRDIRAQVLLLGGSASPKYLQTSVANLAQVIPDAKRVEFAGVGHGVSGNADMGGKPELVAQELREFFG